MRHCTPDELMDLAEGARPEASMPHLASCAVCRQQLLEVREVLVEVRDVPVPEPSPVQWARLSAHVSEAVASEVERSRAPRKERSEKSESRASWAWGLPVAAAAVFTLALVVPGIIRVKGPAPVMDRRRKIQALRLEAGRALLLQSLRNPLPARRRIRRSV